jgi:uncharacterized repeat protein (TIGR03803 family)
MKMNTFDVNFSRVVATVFFFAGGAHAATFSVLHTFGSSGCVAADTDGLAPSGGLTMAGGLLYGFTYAGPFVNGATEGSVYSIDPISGAFETVVAYQVDPVGPRNPAGVLAQGSDGSFYGTAQFGGAGGAGAVVKFTPPAGAAISYSFSPEFNPDNSSANLDGANPRDGVVVATDGTLWGVTANGGADGNGTVFHLDPVTGQLTQIHSFTAQHADFTNADGVVPTGRLVLAGDGNLYGLTHQGGSGNAGTLFSINPATGAFAVVHSFGALSGPTQANNADGALATTGMTAAHDGTLYGVTCSGGSGGAGTAFQFVPSTGVLTTIAAFSTAVSSTNACPSSRLLLGIDGNFYGTTLGFAQAGTLFRLSPQGSVSTLYTFDEGFFDGVGCRATINTSGLTATGDLIDDSQGNLYGTAFSGGLGAAGTVFKLTGAESTSSAVAGSAASSSSGGGSLSVWTLVMLLGVCLVGMMVKYRVAVSAPA